MAFFLGISPSFLSIAGVDVSLHFVENSGMNFKTGYAIKTAGAEWFIGQAGVASTGFRIVDVTNSCRFEAELPDE